MVVVLVFRFSWVRLEFLNRSMDSAVFTSASCDLSPRQSGSRGNLPMKIRLSCCLICCNALCKQRQQLTMKKSILGGVWQFSFLQLLSGTHVASPGQHSEDMVLGCVPEACAIDNPKGSQYTPAPSNLILGEGTPHSGVLPPRSWHKPLPKVYFHREILY